MDNDTEAPKDPGVLSQRYTERDYEGHRAHSVFVGVHMPNSRRHSHRRHKHHHRDGDKVSEYDRPRSNSVIGLTRRRVSITEEGAVLTPPAHRVQFILGEDVDDAGHESHPLFSEMEELVKDGDEIEWKETARWVKFEEDVEEGGDRWSKPHVATLSLHSLFELRSLLTNGTVMLDMEASNLEEIADLVCDNMVNAGSLPFASREKVREALLLRHRHQHEREAKKKDNMSRLPIIRNLAEIGRNHSSSKNLHQTTNKPATSSYSLHLVDTTAGIDDIIPSPQTTQLSGSKKDARGLYLAVPTTVIDDQQNGANTKQGLTPSPSNAFSPAITNADSTNGMKFLMVPGQSAQMGSFSSGDEMVKSPSIMSMPRNASSSELQNGDPHKVNTHFMKKIPPGAEASNILVGEVEFLDKTLSAFLRLNKASIMGDLTEVPIPTRFLFILLGPVGSHDSFHEIGRAMATLMSDEIFHEVAYRAKKRDHLLAAVDEFLDAVTVLPPGEWDPTIRIEPPAAIPSQEVRKRPPEKPSAKEEHNEEDEQRLREKSGLVRTGVLFGGLKNDLRRKVPFYVSDFKDALSSQCIASWIFLYFACLSPIITFGGLLGAATGNNMAAMESLVSGFVCGIGYGFFSGQPLTILGSTGPVLVFETIVFKFCLVFELDYMSFRFWIGTWITVILIIMVAIDASALVCYITRFTEENFATLIAFIFIYKAVENVISIGDKYPIESSHEVYDCVCQSPYDKNDFSWAKYNGPQCHALNGTRVGMDCDKTEPVPNVFLMSTLLFFGTFTTSIILKDFKNALFFPSKVRQLISDFAVIIAIFSMTTLDYCVDIPTPKLDVPSEFKPTLGTRGWLINPFLNHFWWWIIAFFPALLGVILIFMDQQITAVIVNRKENKLKKGCGYHLDLFVLAILIQICTTFGLPWFVAATVLSINHVNSLKLESECAAPGEKPQFLGVREQRVTHVLIFLTIGCSVFLTPLLSHIPMPVLFGVFLYMGAASLKGLQLFDRIMIIFMPVKYQPDYLFLRQVPLKRVHIFTLIQFACLAVLWVIKSYFYTSILFPLMLVVMIGIRKSLDCMFTHRELKILDDIMPEMTRRAAVEDMHNLGEGEQQDQPPPYPGDLEISKAKLSLIIPSKPINITEEVNKTTIWKQVNEGKNDNNSKEPTKRKHSQSSSSGEKKGDRKSLSPTSEQRLSTMAEEEEQQNSEQTKKTTANNLSQPKSKQQSWFRGSFHNKKSKSEETRV
ncbi:sodium-driven chloride bicarbonate exchanger-like isoform X2 [Sitodiplosis mosellana]|nr:sodium-driven chloride bicarbonate exchanger-like isoform X2 [Sitodiplosis mosellana]XP_055296341.1 sodium-driven chloride bicarbonate exchanger-like isoform X2 [Sitodiplosis mosellana]XP_055296343.1 sodium-driven chloride bicarbonate exchanger-like isoform X2 [Sitodiplosis mosellana]XP_055296344.1 sodium-driven chloride bicarbonate exchanger-like isoform X2 [Sitodiplosis mosellana]